MQQFTDVAISRTNACPCMFSETKQKNANPMKPVPPATWLLSVSITAHIDCCACCAYCCTGTLDTDKGRVGIMLFSELQFTYICMYIRSSRYRVLLLLCSYWIKDKVGYVMCSETLTKKLLIASRSVEITHTAEGNRGW